MKKGWQDWEEEHMRMVAALDSLRRTCSHCSKMRFGVDSKGSGMIFQSPHRASHDAQRTIGSR